MVAVIQFLLNATILIQQVCRGNKFLWHDKCSLHFVNSDLQIVVRVRLRVRVFRTEHAL